MTDPRPARASGRLVIAVVAAIVIAATAVWIAGHLLAG